MSVVDPPPQKNSWWSAGKHADDLTPLNICAGCIAALLVVPGVFAGGGGLLGIFLGSIALAPPVYIGVLAHRQGGPRSARVAFIAAGVLLLMIVLQLRN